MDDEPVEEPTAEAVESVDEETASEEIELTAEETPEAGEAPEQPEPRSRARQSKGSCAYQRRERIVRTLYPEQICQRAVSQGH